MNAFQAPRLELRVCVVKYNMRICSAEAHAAHRYSSSARRRPSHPLCRELELPFVNGNFGFRFFEVGIWWYDSRLENHDRFDDTSNPGSTLDMTYLGFHRTNIYWIFSRSGLERLGNSTGLNRIACRGPCPMRLNKKRFFWVKSSFRVNATNKRGLRSTIG